MLHESVTVLHGATGKMFLSEYLYRVVLHVLAIAVVGVGIHWWAGVLWRKTGATIADRERGDQRSE